MQEGQASYVQSQTSSFGRVHFLIAQFRQRRFGQDEPSEMNPAHTGAGSEIEDK
jgi:hypothetical protein